MNYKSYKDLSDDIRNNLSKIHACNVDLVVGLPRSGLTPANMIALYLNLPCTDLYSFIKNERLKSGKTRKTKGELIYPHDAKRVLLVDDSILSGNSLVSDLALIPYELQENVITCAIYSSIPNRTDVDLYLEVVSMPRVFEWNLFHHSITSKSCFDIDGVLCVDPTEDQNDDGDKYKDFILNAAPLFIPSNKVYALVTSRLEKYREETELWLNKYNIEYEHLIMLDVKSKEERQRLNIHGKHKAGFYKKSNTELFIESEYNQSVEIFKITNKPVFCVDENIMLVPNGVYQVKQNIRNSFLKKLFKILPVKVQYFIKKMVKGI